MQNALSLRDQFALLLAKVVVVAIRFLHTGITDSHTSDVGHWFGMTGSCILQQALPFPKTEVDKVCEMEYKEFVYMVRRGKV